jgi:hypothetical protein
MDFLKRQSSELQQLKKMECIVLFLVKSIFGCEHEWLASVEDLLCVKREDVQMEAVSMDNNIHVRARNTKIF